MSEEHIYEEHVHQFGDRLKELVAEESAEPALASDAAVEEKVAAVNDPFVRETSREELDREVAARLGDKTAAQELGMVLLKQGIQDLDDAPGIDLEQFITSARNG
jgi:hypothetical protein